jgi:hypothetical protein
VEPGQVVAKRKGAEDKTTDSLRTLQIMQMIAQTAEHLASDSLQLILQDNERNTVSANLVEQSLQRDDEPETNDEPPVVKIIDQSIGGSVLTSNPALAAPADTKSTAGAKKKTTAKTAVKKTTPAINKPKPVPVKAISDKPKAVMPKAKQNDY